MSAFPNPLRTRFAPTPSGFLHIGNAFSFLVTWLIARRQKGSILLRIDDLDAARMRPEYVQDIFDSIAWLGLTYDEGPTSLHQFQAAYSQHTRLALYQQYLRRLIATENTFYCRCSRKQIQERSPDGQYPMTCRQYHYTRTEGKTALRVITPQHDSIVSIPDIYSPQTVDLYRSMRDFVVQRKDGLPAYQIASLADDAHFRINFVVRGIDLWESTAAQRYLARLLAEDSFLALRFYHHPLLLNENGEKLSKSAGVTALQSLRAEGIRPQKIYQLVCRQYRLPLSAASSLSSLLDAFSALPFMH